MEWVIRGTLAAVAAVVGYFSLLDSLANVVVRIDPARAHALSPGDGMITAALAEEQFGLRPEAGTNSEPARLGRLALRQNPTAVEALSVLGLQAQLRNDIEQARQIFTYSRALSRRELRPQIWAIEEAVSRGDIRGALQQYDIAFRTSRSGSDLLFPILASAIAEPKVRAALLEIMAKEPLWAERFVDFVARRNIDSKAAALFFQEGEGTSMPVDESDRVSVVSSLVGRNFIDEAWDYYKSFRPEADRRLSRDPNFARGSSPASVFDWVVTEEGGVSALIHRGEAGGLMEFSAPPTVGGVALRQAQLLPPGTYRLEGHSIGIEQPERSLPYWVLTCRNGRELGRLTMPNSAHNDGNFTGLFTVSPDCPVQTLSLVLRPAGDLGGVAGQFDRVQLVPAD